MDAIKKYIDDNTRSKTPSAKFKRINDKVVGTINRATIVTTTDKATHQDVENLVVELALDNGTEDGQALDVGSIRSVWFKPGEMLRRLADAMKESNVASVVAGDKLAVEFYGEEPTKNVSPKKLYRVAYKVINSDATPAEAVSVGDLA